MVAVEGHVLGSYGVGRGKFTHAYHTASIATLVPENSFSWAVSQQAEFFPPMNVVSWGPSCQHLQSIVRPKFEKHD